MPVTEGRDSGYRQAAGTLEGPGLAQGCPQRGSALEHCPELVEQAPSKEPCLRMALASQFLKT